MRPYQHLCFQFSLHVQRQPGAEAEHYEFLAADGNDPRRPFLESLIPVLGERGSIVVYNAGFECQRLTELAEWLPEFTDQIKNVQARLWDLLPFVRSHVYHPAFGGSFSLKSVLPALVPTMSYAGMQIGDGRAAGMAWKALIDRKLSEAERESTRLALLQYCGRDTMGLVKLFEVQDS